MADGVKTVLGAAQRANRALTVLAVLLFLGCIVLGYRSAEGSVNGSALIPWGGTGLVVAWVLISVGDWIEEVGRVLDASAASAEE